MDDKIGFSSQEMYFGLKDISKAGTSVFVDKVANTEGSLTFYTRLPGNLQLRFLRVKAENLFDSSSAKVDSKLLMIISVDAIILTLF